MNGRDLIRVVAAELDVPQASVKAVFEATSRVLERALEQGDSVILPEIGTLSSRHRKARTVRSIADARRTFVGERFVVRFAPAGSLRGAVAKRTPTLWKSPEHQAAWRLAETLVADLSLYHAARAPKTFLSDDPVAVDGTCEAAFGESWVRARAEWRSKVPADVASAKDYLADAAFARFGK